MATKHEAGNVAPVMLLCLVLVVILSVEFLDNYAYLLETTVYFLCTFTHFLGVYVLVAMDIMKEYCPICLLPIRTTVAFFKLFIQR